MTTPKPIASLSLDLDNKWSYMKTHGDAGWQMFPSYLDVLVPRVLEFLKGLGLKITFFVVGQDAALEKNHAALRAIADAGHEIGNHSFNHEPWLNLYTEQEMELELTKAEEAIATATGRAPVGFRGPGFSVSPVSLASLSRRRYLYDASTFPTYIGPLARLYYFLAANLTPEERRKRQALYGRVRDGLKPVGPYRWSTNDGSLLEIPVTTMPFFKVPIHVSYLIYLSVYSEALALLYFKMALLLCDLSRTGPSLLMHPLDFLGNDDEGDLNFFPGMGLPGSRKLEFVRKVIDLYLDRYTVLPLRDHAKALTNEKLRVVQTASRWF
jgi:hypothetical protein